MHSRNRHQGHYDLEQLVRVVPELKSHLTTTPRGERSINFSRPESVKLLNRALLASYYSIQDWDLPEGYLCPPIPGRADLIHNLGDLLAFSRDLDAPPRGSEIRVLDIGVGAGCVYPIIGRCEYGWSFVGSDIDADAIASSQKIIDANAPILGSQGIGGSGVELRHQKNPGAIFEGVVKIGEHFDLVVCNPPFYGSLEEALSQNRRKWRNLDRAPHGSRETHLNFGGRESELWCDGGEVGFARRMIRESKRFATQIEWFSILISREAHLSAIYQAIEHVGAVDDRTLEMGQGQKMSRVVCWKF
jgi:23S rRNA (adenine1618-N6)-methyltransferase